jgi:hypothetical protein
MIAALFVETGGVYFGIDGIEPYDRKKDAFTLKGEGPVIAHPPCERWGRYWSGGPSCKVRKLKGDDGGAFAFALAQVRKYGGVLEHPEASHAWHTYGLFTPPKGGGWIVADSLGGWTCCVEQGNYGHPARKATWLYACRMSSLPSLKWGRSTRSTRRLDLGFHSAEERRMFYRPHKGMTAEQRQKRKDWMAAREESEGKALCVPERLTLKERLGTPIPFRDLYQEIARKAYPL